MKSLERPVAWLALGLTLAACGPAGQPASPVEPAPTRQAETAESAMPAEAILILSPAGGSRLVGQVQVEGVADSTFEQNLVIQIVRLGEPEEVLAQQPTTIQAELGQRGPFGAEVSFAFVGPSDQPGEVRVFAASPRDGGLTHLASSHVTLGAEGEAVILSAEAHPERIAITSPGPAGIVQGGVAHIEGVALASFEQTLIIEIHDTAGVLIGSAPVTVQAPDLGLPGPFAADVTYAAAAAAPGRITVRDPSPAFGQTVHLASVEIRIEP